MIESDAHGGSPCGIHILPTPRPKCAFCEAELERIRAGAYDQPSLFISGTTTIRTGTLDGYDLAVRREGARS